MPETEGLDISREWKFRMEFETDVAALGGQPTMPGTVDIDPFSQQFPTSIYNSLIHPWTQFPLRGFIWYQGCRNANAPGDYFILQQLLVSDWRRAWNNPDMPFVITQLSGYSNAGYAALREAQYHAMRNIPLCGMAVTMDHGDLNDIHPHNKTIVGYRLAKEAERLCYGNQGVTSGPTFREMRVEGNKAILHFDHVGGGLVAKDSPDGHLNAFLIAGEDKVFHPAEAIIDGDAVIVSSPNDVPSPVAVRYAWMAFHPSLNFYNAEGFPAVPFRTDTPAWATVPSAK